MPQSDSQRRGKVILLIFALAGALSVIKGGFKVMNQPQAEPHSLRVDLESVPPQVLMALPQIGPARMEAILAEGRQGPFQSVEDVDRRVKGIGPAISSGLRPYLRFGSDHSSKP